MLAPLPQAKDYLEKLLKLTLAAGLIKLGYKFPFAVRRANRTLLESLVKVILLLGIILSKTKEFPIPFWNNVKLFKPNVRAIFYQVLDIFLNSEWNYFWMSSQSDADNPILFSYILRNLEIKLSMQSNNIQPTYLPMTARNTILKPTTKL